MSAALLNATRNASEQSAVTLPDLSLGSLAPSPRNNILVLSSSSQTTASSQPLTTPPHPSALPFHGRKGDDALRRANSLRHDDNVDAAEADLLDTPGAERKKWTEGPETPSAPTRHKRTLSSTKGAHLTLRDQEKVNL